MASKKTRQITHHPISAIIPYERNNKIHSPEQINHIANSIAEFGFNQPIVVDENNIVLVGHGRLLAAQKMGLEEVPTICIADLTEAQKKAYRIIDNKVSADAPWDFEAVQSEMVALTEMDFDMSKFMDAFDFPDQEVRIEVSEDDSSAVLEDDPIVKSGDIIHLGEHRIICGDSTDAKVFLAAHQGESMDLVITDPPYGVEYDPSWRNQAGAAKTKRTGKVLNDDRADWREAWALFPGDVAYVWHGALHAATVADSLVAAGFAIRSQIIWAKDRLVLSRGDYHWQHEPCWYAVRAKGKGHWAGDRKQTTLWQIANRDQDADTVHGTQKPVECMRRPILNNSSPGQAVYEPFMGSGTTLIAAETTGRVCFGVELNPAYVDVAIERWQSFTGQDAVLVETGDSFADLKAKRHAA